LKIEGMFSGTLNYVLSKFMESEDPNQKMTDIVHQAWENGITEPNPIDDLSGMDVARKILILSRIALYEVEGGLPLVNQKGLELSDINLQGLVPFPADSPKIFFEQMKNFDEIFQNKKSSALKNNKTLKYIAKFENSKISVGLEEIDLDHPFAKINGTTNVASVVTDIYDEPIILTGYGAGTFQTASGVLSDVMSLN